MLDISTLRTLHKHGSLNYHRFQQLTENHLASVKHDGLSKSIPLEIRVTHYVRTLSGKKLDQMVSKPVGTEYYYETIYLRIGAYESANKEKVLDIYYDAPLGDDSAHEKLHDIVNISRNTIQACQGCRCEWLS